MSLMYRDGLNLSRKTFLAEDASSKKFLVSNFNHCKMSDSRPVMEKYNEFLCILRQFAQHTIKMDKSISVLSIVDKLSPLWRDFKHMINTHKRKRCLLYNLTTICA